MLKNYFKIAWRNIWKYPKYSMVNILGLAMSLAALWLILLYIGHELSFDRFHAKADRIFRVVQHATWPEGNLHIAPTSAPFAEALKTEFPEIKEAVRFDREGGGAIRVKNNKIVINDIFFTDAYVFEAFSYKFLYGDPKSALSKPRSIVLTKSLAEKLFGIPQLALGETVYFENNFGNLVTGVIEDVPLNSHLQFSALRSLSFDSRDEWQNFHLYTYVLLHDNAKLEQLESKLPIFFTKYLRAEMGNVDYRLELQPLTSIHLFSHLDFEFSANGNIKNIYIFLTAALVILIIAAINYMNLAAARSALRVKEVGVRKVIGSGKKQLVLMFLLEAGLVTFIAFALGLLFAELSLPYISHIAQVKLSLWQFGSGRTLLVLLLIYFLVSLLCGIYPATFLSSFKTAVALKGQLGTLSSNITLRKALIIFQFAVAIIMITGSWIIYSQLQYVLHKDLGFNKEQVLSFHLSSQDARNNVPFLKDKLLESPLIHEVSAASNPIGTNLIGANGFYLESEGGEMATSTQIIKKFSIDDNFLPTLEIDLKEGRNFSADNEGDMYNNILVNEALVKKAGWKNPIGKMLQFDVPGRKIELEVIGVVKDFHIYSLQHSLEPLVLHRITPEERDNIYVRIQPNNATEAIDHIQEVYQTVEASAPFLYKFLDQNFAQQYQSEIRQGNLLLIFTLLAIFLALFGLFGLTAFAVEKRSKEIGVRKVLGATLANIVTLLSLDFLKLIFISFLIAIPFAWWIINNWLVNFAYHTMLEWWIFALAGGLVIILAGVTIGYQAIKAALTNPVDSLKEE